MEWSTLGLRLAAAMALAMGLLLMLMLVFSSLTIDMEESSVIADRYAASFRSSDESRFHGSLESTREGTH